MSGFSFSHLSDSQVMHEYKQAKGLNRASDARLLACLAEIESRKLFVEASYPSMHAFVVAEFDLTDDMARNRTRASRVARSFPTIFAMLSDGRLQLSAVLQLAPHLRAESADDLLDAAAGKTKSEIERMLAQRFPRTELMSWTMGPESMPMGPESTPMGPESTPTMGPESTPIPVSATNESAPPQGGSELPNADQHTSAEQKCEVDCVPERVEETRQEIITPPLPTAPRTHVTPIAAHAYGVQFMMDQDAHDDLEYLRAVLGHQAPTVARVIALALKSLRRDVDRRKFAATDRPRKPRPASAAPSEASSAKSNPRRIPNHIRRAVSMRDQYRCSFVGKNGRRCDARAGLELDHVVPVALGGQATVENLRLLCRAHNQHAADRTFGVTFMNGKRVAARQARRPGDDPGATTERSAKGSGNPLSPPPSTA